jgi:ATP-binding cassette subfamily B protein
MSVQSSVPALRLYARALGEARAFWPHLGAIFALGLLATPIGLLNPLPLKIIADSVFGDQPLPWPLGTLFGAGPGPDGAFAVAIGLSLGLVVVNLGWRLGDWFFREWVGERMVLAFRRKLFARVLEIARPGEDTRVTQDYAYRIESDAPSLQWTALYGFMPPILCLVSLAATLFVAARLEPVLAMVALATTLPAIGLVHFSQKRMRSRWHAARGQESGNHAVVQEVLGALRLVVTFGQEKRELARFAAQGDRTLATRFGALRAESIVVTGLTLATGLGASLVLWLGASGVRAGTLTVGDLLLVIGYVAQLYEPLQAIGTHINGQQQAIVAAERAFALLDRPAAVVEAANPERLGRAKGDVAFEEVTFAYPGTGQAVLRDVSLAIPAGTRVGIVGPTGSGKSTLANLLLRLFDPDCGTVRLDGIDLRSLSLADLRAQFAVVPQDPALFSTTIAANIAYGRPDATREEIEAAAKAAQAHDFIMRLPDGYATTVGDRGTRLSGGERQRIALARAFLKDAPILILDEPTSALDTATEAEIVESLDRLMEGRTTLMIAHRLSTLRSADVILRVEDGTVTVAPPEPALKLVA